MIVCGGMEAGNGDQKKIHKAHRSATTGLVIVVDIPQRNVINLTSAPEVKKNKKAVFVISHSGGPQENFFFFLMVLISLSLSTQLPKVLHHQCSQIKRVDPRGSASLCRSCSGQHPPQLSTGGKMHFLIKSPERLKEFSKFSHLLHPTPWRAWLIECWALLGVSEFAFLTSSVSCRCRGGPRSSP